MSENVIKLANRLKEEFGIDVNPKTFRRTYAGRHQRGAGAFLWLFPLNLVGEVGGCEPMLKYIVKRNRLDIRVNRFNDIEIYVYTPGEVGYDKLIR